jgi:hypothetical protein
MNLKKMERYLRVNLLGPGPSSYKKIIYRAAVSQRLGNTAIKYLKIQTKDQNIRSCKRLDVIAAVLMRIPACGVICTLQLHRPGNLPPRRQRQGLYTNLFVSYPRRLQHWYRTSVWLCYMSMQLEHKQKG